jgi:hypothetical protein
MPISPLMPIGTVPIIPPLRAAEDPTKPPSPAADRPPSPSVAPPSAPLGSPPGTPAVN